MLEFFKKEIAGIPAWMWGVIIGGSIAVYAWIVRKDDDTITVASAAPISPIDYGAAGSAEDIAGIPTITPTTITPTNNPAWIRIVADGLVADGQDPVQVNNALTKVLAGLEVTAQEAALWSIAVRKYGQPPEGAPPIVTGATTTTPEKPATKTVEVPGATHLDKFLQLHGMTMEQLLTLNPGIAEQYIRVADLEGWQSETNPIDPRYATFGFAAPAIVTVPDYAA
jgi:hypothetical protein